jgi:2-C-methyl-D-erythritol 4-phosphate cytidylyltransferase
MRMVAAVLAGGTGQRFGAGMPKQLLSLDGRTLLEHCVAAFEEAPSVDEIIVVMDPGHATRAGKLLSGYRKLSGIIAGGATRTESARNAIAAISSAGKAAGNARGDDCGVLLHDAARPLVDQRIIADCAAALRAGAGAVGVAVPSSDTIVVADGGAMRHMPRRDTLLRCQTPQGFRLPVIARAHELARADPGFTATDDCGVVLRYLPEVTVRVIPGSERNIKITYPRDLAIAEALLKADG